jgi:phosphoenolpyruvate-protein kinase (PTS system EI component)
VAISGIGTSPLRGVPASPGIGVGAVRRLAAPVSAQVFVPEEQRGGEIERALDALAGAGSELDALAARLRAEGRDTDAEIVETGALMALDPGLADSVKAAIGRDGLPAGEAIVTACSAQADLLSALPDELLAARADDVRSLGRRAALLTAGSTPPSVDGCDVVLVAEDLGPADVAELDAGVQAVALAGGGATAHAAIVARSLAIPLVAELGDGVRALADGALVVVDGSEGVVLAEPDAERVQHARCAAARRNRAREHAAAQRAVPAVTRDGRRMTVLANVAGAAELRLALDAGAEGVGLLRSELAFLQADSWPTQAQHRRALEPVLAGLAGRPATVRVLDYGGDKLPPFLDGARERGIGLLLQAPHALAAQLRAILESAAGAEVRVLVPMVGSLGQLEAAATAVRAAADAVGAPAPPLGPMIETPEAAGIADALAQRADFLSIGTNDLTAATLGADRFAPGAGVAHDPRVLAAIAASVQAARRAAIPIEVCGEAASDPVALPLLVGLGVDELSVGASRVGTVRAWVRELVHRDARELATRALGCTSARQVEALVAPVAERLAAVERGDPLIRPVARGQGQPAS